MNTVLTHKQIESAKKSSYKRFHNFVETQIEKYVDCYYFGMELDYENGEGFYTIKNDIRGIEEKISLTYKDLVYYKIFTPILRKYYENK